MNSRSIEAAFAESIQLFDAAEDKNGDRLRMNYFGASHAGTRLQHSFGIDEPVDMRSVSKPILSITLGALIREGAHLLGSPLSLDTMVPPLLERHFPSHEARRMWAGVSIRHLITNTIGHEAGFLFRKDLVGIDEADYVSYALSQKISYAPGTHFSYSNVGPYLISVILQDHLGVSLQDIAAEKVLRPLGIQASWRNYGPYTAGCTGLSMSGAQLLTFGETVLAGGMLSTGEQLSDTQYVREATTLQLATPGMFDPSRVFPKYGYGYAFWICEDGAYYCDGTDGQYLIVVPAADLVIVTTGSQPDMKPITRCMIPVLESAGREVSRPGFRGGSDSPRG